ncbi:hypothetical protein AMTRI_Chr10g2540 [Amborella trichopoda]
MSTDMHDSLSLFLKQRAFSSLCTETTRPLSLALLVFFLISLLSSSPTLLPHSGTPSLSLSTQWSSSLYAAEKPNFLFLRSGTPSLSTRRSSLSLCTAEKRSFFSLRGGTPSLSLGGGPPSLSV